MCNIIGEKDVNQFHGQIQSKYLQNVGEESCIIKNKFLIVNLQCSKLKGNILSYIYIYIKRRMVKVGRHSMQYTKIFHFISKLGSLFLFEYKKKWSVQKSTKSEYLHIS